MGDHLVIRVKPQTKKKFFELARMEGKTASVKIRELMEGYISRNDVGPLVDNLWKTISLKMRERELSQADVENAIRTVREGR
jgi:hypothetical protein